MLELGPRDQAEHSTNHGTRPWHVAPNFQPGQQVASTIDIVNPIRAVTSNLCSRVETASLSSLRIRANPVR